MSQTIAVKNEGVYGAFELKQLYPRNYAVGVAIAIFLHLLGIGSYYFYQAMTKEDSDNIPTVRIMKYSELGPPPSIANEAPPQIAIAAQVAPPTVGVPVPVPDEQAPPEQTIATQQEMSKQAAPALGNDVGTGAAQITQDIKIEQQTDDPDMNAFVAVEKLPEMVVAAKPEYPEIAKRAGITGKVFVKVLVDKEGRPKKAVVIKTDSELFNQSAVEAAMKSAFTPALQNNHPIAVWIVLPYRFTLADQQ
ncbi:MAG: energy transducer TonB [Bacteroidetes bacterium]|nr:energy transducer TonB [Bacteroidota bacterium]MCL6100135.1 energy transducer TonB [Bacteroidota bacterium]